MSEGQVVDSSTNTILWVARILGSLFGLIWLIGPIMTFIGELSTKTYEFSVEGLFVGIFSTVVAAGAIIAWWHEKIGGWILIIGGLLFGAFSFITAGRNQIWIALFISVPFVIAGYLYLRYWNQTHGR